MIIIISSYIILYYIYRNSNECNWLAFDSEICKLKWDGQNGIYEEKNTNI